MDEALNERVAQHLDGLAPPVTSGEVHAREVEVPGSRAPRLLVAAALVLVLVALAGGMVVLAGEDGEPETVVAGPTPTIPVDGAAPVVRDLGDGQAEVTFTVLHDTPELPLAADLWVWAVASSEEASVPDGWHALYRNVELDPVAPPSEAGEGIWRSRVSSRVPTEAADRIVERSTPHPLAVTPTELPLVACSPPPDNLGCTPPTFTPEDVGGDAAGALDPIPFEELPPPLYRGGDVVLSLDGFEPDAEGEVHPVAYLAPADGSGEAIPVDLAEVGPRRAVEVGWSGEEFLLAGLRCPDRWDPADQPADGEAPDSNMGQCGSTLSDVFALDPESGELSVRAEGIDGGQDFSLVFAAATPDHALFSGGGPDGEWLLIGTDGTVEQVAPLPRTTGLDRSGQICAVDGALYGLTTRDIPGGQAAPLADHVALSELVDGTWVPRSVPEIGVASPYTWMLGCTARGPLVTGSYDGAGDPFGFAWLELVDGEWSWRRLGPSGLPPLPDGQTFAPSVVGESPVLSLLWLTGQAPEAADYSEPQPFWVWDGSTWQSYAPTAAFPAAVLGDHEGLIGFTEAGELTLLRPVSGG